GGGAVGTFGRPVRRAVSRVPRRARAEAGGSEPGAGHADPEPRPLEHPGRAGTRLRVRPRRQADDVQRRDVVRRPVGHQDRRRRHVERRLRTNLGGAEARHARSLDSEERRRRLGPSHPHSFRGGTGARAQRQRGERAAVGARTQGRVSAPSRRQRDHHDAVPRLRRHLHGALPQHGARGQLDAAALGRESRRRDRPHRAADADPDTAGGHLHRSRRRAARRTKRRRTMIARAVVALLLLLAVSGTSMPGPAQTGTPRDDQYFPDVQLTTQDGTRVRFYDLIKGKTVAIELIYTSCRFACPLETARLAQVQRLLGDRMGRDVFFYSISIDPEHDTPAVLKAFAETFHAGPGWTFLTGRRADIERLARRLGLYSTPNPEDKDGHVPALLIGNESTGDWMRASALDNPNLTATIITRTVA